MIIWQEVVDVKPSLNRHRLEFAKFYKNLQAPLKPWSNIIL